MNNPGGDKVKNFIGQISPKQIIRAVITITCILGFGLITLGEGLVRGRLYDQQMAGRWSDEKDVAQVSCFFSEKEVSETDYFLGIRANLDKAFQEAAISTEKENTRLWIDAVSRPGKVTIANGAKTVELEAVGVMGDFFQFHPLDLKKGSFFSSESMMQDGIVIDEETAWQLFGSSDVVGMEVTIGQVPHFVVGVVQKETGRIAEAAGLEKSLCYLSMESLEQYGTVTGGYCYETVLPNPVEGFALSTLNTAIGGEKKQVQLVENSSRYEFMPTLQVIRNFGLRSMSSQGIVYPYWENIARAYEDIFALTLFTKITLLIFPCIQAICGLVFLWKKVSGSLENGYSRISDYLYDYEVKHPGGNKKRWVFVGASLCLIFVVAFFGSRMQKNEQEAASTQVRNASLIYREGESLLGEEGQEINQFVLVGDTLYTEAITYGSLEEMAEESVVPEETEGDSTEESAQEAGEMAEAVMTRRITAYDLQGNQKNQITITAPESTGFGAFTADSEGNIYSFYTTYDYGENGEDNSKTYLRGYSSAGEELFSTPLNENQAEGEYYYANSIYCVKDSRLVMDTSVGIEVYDLQGEQQKRIEREDGAESRLFKIRDDQFAVITINGEEAFSQTLDIETGQKGEKLELPFNFYFYNAFSGGYYDLYLSNEKGAYGFNLGDAEITPIMDFVASDLASYGFNQMEFVDETTILAYYYGDMGGNLALFSQIPEGEVVEKAELTLGCYYLDDEVKKQVIAFNKASNTHRITIMDYSQYNTEEDYTIGLNRLNSDIASGKIPDIVLLQGGMPIESYIAKGVFADYYELMEEDADFNREDYLANVFEAYETEGKLYQLVPAFSIRTFVGKEELVGEDYSWTMDEALAIEEAQPQGTRLFSNMTQNSFLMAALYTCSDEYVDWETGQCYFDTDKFIRMLEYAKTLPKEPENIDYNDAAAYQEMEMQYREGRTILSQGFLTGFNDYGYWKYTTFGEEVGMVGFPTESGIGSSFSGRFNLAISAQSKNKEAAWEFIKSFLTEEYQDGIDFYFPIRISSLKKLEEKAWEKPYYLDEKGNKVEYEQTYWIGNMEIAADPLTREETGKVMHFIKSINRVESYNENIINIVMEEAAVYFAEEKTAREAADIIQSRVKIYVNENR